MADPRITDESQRRWRTATEEMSLGGIALQRNNGVPAAALADLVTQVVGMCGFMHAQGIAQDVILEVFDAMTKSGREALVGIMEEDSRGRAG